MPKAMLTVDRRSKQRVPVKIPVTYRLETDEKILRTVEEWRGARKHAFTLDLSLQGMRLAAGRELEKGMVLRFDLFLLGKVQVASIYAAVRWVRDGQAGLRFLMMKEKEMGALDEFLKNSASRVPPGSLGG